MYSQVRSYFRPIPDHPYYIFTLHDLSHIFNGIMLLSPKSLQNIKSETCKKLSSDNFLPLMVRLWCHECIRVLSDRISDAQGNSVCIWALNLNQRYKRFQLDLFWPSSIQSFRNTFSSCHFNSRALIAQNLSFLQDFTITWHCRIYKSQSQYPYVSQNLIYFSQDSRHPLSMVGRFGVGN